MARPLKVSYESICERYKEARRINCRYPVSYTAKNLGISTRTVNRALVKSVEIGLIPASMVYLPPFKPKLEPAKTELTVFFPNPNHWYQRSVHILQEAFMSLKNTTMLFRRLNDGTAFECKVDPQSSKITEYKGDPQKTYAEMKAIGHPLVYFILNSGLSKGPKRQLFGIDSP